MTNMTNIISWPFYDFVKMETYQDLAIINTWYLQFLIVPYLLFQKNGTLESWHNWLLSNQSRFLNWKGPGTYPESSRLFKRFLKITVLAFLYKYICIYIYIYILAGQVWWLNELWLKRYIQNASCLMCSCANTHCDVIDLVNHGMVKNTKIWISWERNMTILWNKKILNLCLKWNILKS